MGMVTRNPLELPKNGRILALDVGARRVGMATCDSGRTTALSAGACERPYAALKAKLASTLAGGAFTALVVGYPLHMDGSEGPMTQAAGDLARQLEKDTGLPVLLWDERLTSRAAEAAWFEQREGRQTRGARKDSVGKMDAGAAALILQGVLDALRHG